MKNFKETMSDLHKQIKDNSYQLKGDQRYYVCAITGVKDLIPLNKTKAILIVKDLMKRFGVTPDDISNSNPSWL
jgi:hypothetical protein